MTNRNTPKQIRERREKIMLLLSRGFSQIGDIAEELKLSRRTVDSDMKYINEISNKEFYELAKTNPSKMYSDYVSDMDEIMTELWKIYKDQDTNANDKLVALRTMSDIHDRKVAMFQEVMSNYHDHDHDLT